MYDPRTELAQPSRYAATRTQPRIGEVVLHAGQAYLVAAILDMSQPIHPDWQTGLHYVLRRANWAKTIFLIVPAREIEQPQELAA